MSISFAEYGADLLLDDVSAAGMDDTVVSLSARPNGPSAACDSLEFRAFLELEHLAAARGLAG